MNSRASNRSIDPEAVVLGVDIGGTNTKFGYVDREGKCLASASMPTNAHQPAGQFFQSAAREGFQSPV